MEAKYDEVFAFLSKGIFPDGFGKAQKQNLRRYASKFKIIGTEMYYNCKGSKKVVRTKWEAALLFKEFHDSSIGGHTGINKTREALCSRFYWLGMGQDIDQWISECDKCQRIGKPLTAVVPLQSIKVSEVWELLGIDITGPLPRSTNGYQYILTATDFFSKWVEAYPLKTKTAMEVSERIVDIIYRHGCPKRILTDQGREFVNQINLSLCKILSIERSVTSAYHPQTNGLDEKTNDNIKRALRKLVSDCQEQWDIYLNATLFSLRSKMHTGTKCSPFMLMYGREARFPSEVPIDFPLSNIILPRESDHAEFLQKKLDKFSIINEKAHNNMEASRKRQNDSYVARQLKKYKDLAYNVGDEVLLYNARKQGRKGGRMEADFSGPYNIFNIKGKTVTLKNKKGDILKSKTNISHLKPYRRSSLGMTAAEIIKNETSSVRQTETPISPVYSINSIKEDSPVAETLSPSRCSVIKYAGSKKSQSGLCIDCESIEAKVFKAATQKDLATMKLVENQELRTSRTTFSIEDKVKTMWSSKDSGQLKAVVGTYHIYDSTIRELQGNNWLSDVVIDAYLYILINKEKQMAYQLNAVVGTELYNGRFRCFRNMKFPNENMWIWPINTGGHWILSVIQMSERKILLADPLGNEKLYEEKIISNWKKFLENRMGNVDTSSWTTTILQHKLQTDGSSCGVLIVKFAQHFLLSATLLDVDTAPQSIAKFRLEIATALLEEKVQCENLSTLSLKP